MKAYNEGLAFTSEYLFAVGVNFETDLRVIDSMMITTGQEPITDEYKRECKDGLDARMRACNGCPEYALAVWSDKTL